MFRHETLNECEIMRGVWVDWRESVYCRLVIAPNDRAYCASRQVNIEGAYCILQVEPHSTSAKSLVTSSDFIKTTV